MGGTLTELTGPRSISLSDALGCSFPRITYCKCLNDSDDGVTQCSSNLLEFSVVPVFKTTKFRKLALFLSLLFTRWVHLASNPGLSLPSGQRSRILSPDEGYRANFRNVVCLNAERMGEV
jgi:hypothetical protein